jgi:hypothetical protein
MTDKPSAADVAGQGVETGRLTGADSLQAEADLVDRLLALVEDRYPADVDRYYSRAQAAEIIRLAVWGYGVLAGSTASAYVADGMKSVLAGPRIGVGSGGDSVVRDE